MDNETEPLAQDPNAPDGQEDGEGSKKSNTVPQERVDEITAKMRDYERQLNASHERELALLTAQAAGSHKQEVEVDEYPDMDPAIKDMFRKQTAKATNALHARLAQSEANYQSLIMAQEADAFVTKMGGDEQTRASARTYATELRKRNIPVTSEEAGIFALGLAVKEGRYTPPQTASGQPARRGAAPIGNVRQTDFTPAEQQVQKPLPSNFDSLSYDKQIEILEKRGAGDTKL